jgi:hypothetical protein
MEIQNLLIAAIQNLRKLLNRTDRKPIGGVFAEVLSFFEELGRSYGDGRMTWSVAQRQI